MEIKIDIDIDKIDYDAINKQISEKIAEMDLAANYNFKYKIENRIDEEVATAVSEYLRYRRWGDLNQYSKEEFKDMLYNKAREIICPKVFDIISQIPEEEMNKIISDLIPRVLVDILTSIIMERIHNYWDKSSEVLMEQAANRVRSFLNY